MLAPLAAREPSAVAKVTFDKDVKPVFKKHCVSCHNPERPRGDLDLSSFAGVMAGGLSGKVAAAGKPDDSPLYLLPAHLGDPEMPPGPDRRQPRQAWWSRRTPSRGCLPSAPSP
jgi:hypothetical protein